MEPESARPPRHQGAGGSRRELVRRGNLAMGADHAFVWINEQYGRMCTRASGTSLRSSPNPNVRTLLQNAILWAAEKPAPAAPAISTVGARRRIVALAEPGQTIHQPFADAALRWLQEPAPKEGFTVDYIRTTDPIDEAYLAAHDLLFRSTIRVPLDAGREAAFKKAMEQGTMGWVGVHHASLLGKFDGFEMSPFFHQFMGDIVFKSYIRLRDRDRSGRGPSASAVEGCRRRSRSRTTRWVPRTIAHLDPTCTCSRMSMRTARSRAHREDGDHQSSGRIRTTEARNVGTFNSDTKPISSRTNTITTMFLNTIRWASER